MQPLGHGLEVGGFEVSGVGGEGFLGLRSGLLSPVRSGVSGSRLLMICACSPTGRRKPHRPRWSAAPAAPSRRTAACRAPIRGRRGSAGPLHRRRSATGNVETAASTRQPARPRYPGNENPPATATCHSQTAGKSAPPQPTHPPAPHPASATHPRTQQVRGSVDQLQRGRHHIRRTHRRRTHTKILKQRSDNSSPPTALVRNCFGCAKRAAARGVERLHGRACSAVHVSNLKHNAA